MECGFPMWEGERYAFPKSIETAKIQVPVFKVMDKEKPYQYTQTLETIEVKRFYVKHHPEGYTEAQKKFGNGTFLDPYLDFKTACKKIDNFMKISCRL